MEFNATFIVSAVSFILFTLIMNKIFYKPIKDILEKRQKYLDENADAAKNNTEKAKAIQNDTAEKIANYQTEAKKEVVNESENLKIEKTQKESEIKDKLSQEIADKKSLLLEEKEKAKNELAAQTGDLSAAIVGKLLNGEG